MPKHSENRFEKNPKAVLGLLYGLVTIALLVGAFFLVKAVHDEAKRGVERYIVLREPRPDSDIPQTPNRELVAVADGLERKAYPFRIDADGYIKPSAMHQKPDLTVVFLGGSTTECMYMQEEERFPYLVGRRLEKGLGLKVNALNGGNAGNNTLHLILALQAKVLARKPQAIVLMECINDLNYLALMGSYWTPHASRGVVFDKEYNPIKKLILRKVTGRTSPSVGGGDDEFAGQRAGLNLDPASILPAYRTNLEHFVYLCRQHGVLPVLMTQFNRYTDTPDENVLRQMKVWGVPYETWRSAYLIMQQAMRQVAAEQKVELIDLDTLVPKTREFMYDGVHLNARGADFVATAISERLPDILRRGGALR